MTFTKTLFAGLAASALLSGIASAADDKPFDGIYGGIEAGVDWTKLAADTKKDRSVYYGGVIGYRTQNDDGMVVGLEGTFGNSGYKNAAGANTDYEWSTSLVLGQTFGNDGGNLLYGKAGYVQTRFDATDATSGGTYKDGGWRFGAGYERALTEGLSFRVGGDYTTYGQGVKQWQGKAGLIASF